MMVTFRKCVVPLSKNSQGGAVHFLTFYMGREFAQFNLLELIKCTAYRQIRYADNQHELNIC
jgi:hypothetical protein